MTTPYSALRQLLAHMDDSPEASPSGIHGLWVGRLAAGGADDSAACWSYTLRFLGRSDSMDSIDSRLSQAFMGLIRFTLGSMEQSDFTFTPWLPDDEANCRARLLALAEWSRGFLEGLVSVTGNDLAQLSEDTRELLTDLMDIGDVDLDIDESEQDEREYEELAEFVKVAALNIFLDIRNGHAPARSTREQEDSAEQENDEPADYADSADADRFFGDAGRDSVDPVDASDTLEHGAEPQDGGDGTVRIGRGAGVKPTLH